jgi:phosphatidylserine decarboxylase
VLVMPADGVISQLGAIEDDKILQAKGHYTGSAAGRNYQMADLFRNGSFATTCRRATTTACTCRATVSCAK